MVSAKMGLSSDLLGCLKNAISRLCRSALHPGLQRPSTGFQKFTYVEFHDSC
jgi:hypothetical protein